MKQSCTPKNGNSSNTRKAASAEPSSTRRPSTKAKSLKHSRSGPKAMSARSRHSRGGKELRAQRRRGNTTSLTKQAPDLAERRILDVLDCPSEDFIKIEELCERFGKADLRRCVWDKLGMTDADLEEEADDL